MLFDFFKAFDFDQIERHHKFDFFREKTYFPSCLQHVLSYNLIQVQVVPIQICKYNECNYDKDLYTYFCLEFCSLFCSWHLVTSEPDVKSFFYLKRLDLLHTRVNLRRIHLIQKPCLGQIYIYFSITSYSVSKKQGPILFSKYKMGHYFLDTQ